MKKRLVVPFVGLALSLALPTNSQQKDLADPQTTQKILAIDKALGEAINNHDPAAIAALYTRDVVFVTTEGPITGREGIQNWYAAMYQWWHPKNHITKVYGNASLEHYLGQCASRPPEFCSRIRRNVVSGRQP